MQLHINKQENNIVDVKLITHETNKISAVKQLFGR